MLRYKGIWDLFFISFFFTFVSNRDPLDWKCQNKDLVVKRVVSKVKEDDIILLHDSYQSTVEATFEIIDTLEKEGYEFVTLDEMILE